MRRAALPRRLSALVALTAVSSSLLLALTAPVATAATVRYVAPWGDDTTRQTPPNACQGGTAEAPWRTVTFAFWCLRTGDTLWIRGGEYTERVYTNSQPGPVTVRSWPGERVLIRGAILMQNADRWTLDGLDVTSDAGAYGPGEYLVKFTGGSGWSYLNSEVWGARSYAAVRVEWSSNHGAPTDWRIAGNCVHDTARTHGENQDHNVYVWTGKGGSGVIERNIIFGASNGNNLKLGDGSSGGGAEDVVVRHNTMYRANQNVVVTGASTGNLLEYNLMGEVTGKDWYPNIRALELDAPGNTARRNITVDSARAVLNEGSPYGVSDVENRTDLDPRPDDTTSCAGFYPTNPGARWYGAYAPPGSPSPRVRRLAGLSRVTTAVELSRATFERATTVLIARADNYPDALAGAPLAAALDAPILLSGTASLPAEVAAEIRRLGATHAILLGGKAALSDAVAAQLDDMGLTVERLWGDDRFDTAIAVAHRLARAGGDMRHAYVVEGADADPGRGWPDAVAVGFLAARLQRPILLVTTESLPQATRDALGDLGVDDAVVVGGPGAVSDAVLRALGVPAARVFGATRFETSAAVANEAVKAGADPADVWFATGNTYPDALTAGPAVAAVGGVLLLVPGSGSDLGPAGAWLAKYEGRSPTVTLVGGPGAVSDAIEDKTYRALHLI